MKIYFAGIGGVALGPLAEIAADAGYTVLGSDASESLTTRELRARNINVHIGTDPTRIDDSIDWFVYTPALPDSHPELVRARELSLRVTKRDELLAHIFTEKKLKLIAVSGTHGKTTTTGMLVWAFMQLGVPISYSVGSTLSFGPSGRYDPASEYFIYECDEFDRNFLHFYPHISLVTSLDYDHPDTYATKDEYVAAFMQFATQSKFTITWQEYMQVFPGARLLDTVHAGIALAGEHNRRNAGLAYEVLHACTGADEAACMHALNSFPGVDRRFERLAPNVYSDYGHHPAEIAATLQLAREISDNVALVYQPHQNIRQHELREQYTDQFEAADKVFWLPTYLTRENPELEVLTPEQLCMHVTNRNSIEFAEMNDDLWRRIEELAQNDYLVLLMGAGTVDDWARQQLIKR